MKGARRDLAWGVLSQGLQYGSALLVLPLLVTRLPSAQVGLWFVFMAIQSLVTILDFGFAPTFSRNFAFVFAGVQELRAEGIAEGRGDLNPALLAAVIRASRLLYAGIALAVGLALALPGSWYLHHLLQRNPGLTGIWPAWTLFSTAIAINLYFLWYTPLLLGSGQVRQEYKVGILNRGGFALFAALALVAGGTLVHVAGAYLAGVLLSRVYAGRAARSLIARTQGRAATLDEALRVVRTLWQTSYRSGLVSFGAFLITRFSVFVISSFYGLAASARYSISVQVFSVVLALSQVGLITFLPRFAALRVADDRAEIRRLFLRVNLSVWVLFSLGATLVILWGNPLLERIHARTLMLDQPLLILLAVIWLLEANHATSAALIATGNTIPFLRAALLSGLAIALGATLAGWQGLGVGAVILVQGLVQLAYNNWKWPSQVYAELGIRWRDWAEVVKPSRNSFRG